MHNELYILIFKKQKTIDPSLSSKLRKKKKKNTTMLDKTYSIVFKTHKFLSKIRRMEGNQNAFPFYFWPGKI